VRMVALLGRFIGASSLETDEGAINAGFDGTSEGLRGSGQSYSRAQTGDAHGYLLTLAVSFVVLVVVLLIGGAR
jgi:NADH-quinone oxidoreductase subunit L